MAGMNGTDGGSFENPAHPENYTPNRDTSHVAGYDDGVGKNSPNTSPFNIDSDGDVGDNSFEPLGYQGWSGHEERNTITAATGVDHDSDDMG